MRSDAVPGRSTSAAFRYQPEALAGPARLSAATLYVVGGLYGNPVALDAVLRRADREPTGPATIVFNGDFHWLDLDLDDFRTINRAVAARHAVTGDPRALADSLYGTTVGSVRCDALPVPFDTARWTARFVAQWPRGSAGHLAYHQRIVNGTTLRPEQAARGTVRLTAPA